MDDVLKCGHDNDFAHVVKTMVTDIVAAHPTARILLVLPGWSEIESAIIFSVQAEFQALGVEQPKLDAEKLKPSVVYGLTDQLEAMWKLEQAAQSTAIN